MECPYCKKEMQKGFILGERFGVRWYPEDSDLWADEERSIILATPGGAYGARTESWYCPECRKVITLVPENQSRAIWEFVQSKLATLVQSATAECEKYQAEREKHREEREAERQEREKEKKRKKDPWEV